MNFRYLVLGVCFATPICVTAMMICIDRLVTPPADERTWWKILRLFVGDERRRRNSVKVFAKTLAAQLLLSLLIIVFIPEYWRPVFDYLIDRLGTHGTQVVIGTGICLMGFGAHAFKKHNQFLYGVVEVIFGGSSAFAVALGISSRSATPSQWATLVGCAYVIARGLNNVSDAKMAALVKP